MTDRFDTSILLIFHRLFDLSIAIVAIRGLTAIVEALEVAEQVRSELLVNLEEYIFKVGHGHTIGLDIELNHSLIQSFKEAAEVICIGLWNNVGYLILHLTSLLYIGKV